MRLCSIKGCKEKHNSDGLCIKHYMRFKRTGSVKLRGIRLPDNLSRDDAVKFYLSKAVRNNSTGCLEMTYCLNSDGYAAVFIEGKTKLLHRVVMEEFLDLSLEKHDFVCHKCHNPSCVNIKHLYVGTQADNMADRDRAGRGVVLRGDDHGGSKLTGSNVSRIRELYRRGVPQKKLARRFSITQAQISNIVRRVNWNHVA